MYCEVGVLIKLQYHWARVCWKTSVPTKLKIWALTTSKLKVVMCWECWKRHS